MATESAQVLLAAAVQAISGSSAATDSSARDRFLRQTLAVTAGSGSLQVQLEASDDGASGWELFGEFAPTPGVSVEKLSFVSPKQWVRVTWVGDVAFTFGVTGTRDVVYANLDDLDRFGMPNAALDGFTPSARCDALKSASDDADGKLTLRYDYPLTAWGSVTKRVCQIACYELMSARGFDPENGDMNIRDRFDDAWKWLAQVADGHINPIDIVDTTPTVDDDGPVFATYEPRRW